MQCLSMIVEHINKLSKKSLDASSCKLFRNKNELDMSTPLRFANIPSGVTLELRSGAPNYLPTSGIILHFGSSVLANEQI